jgi:hypothetical protein
MIHQQERANKELLTGRLGVDKHEIGAAAAVGWPSWSRSKCTIKTIFLLYARPGVGDAAPLLFASSALPGGGQVFTVITPRYWPGAPCALLLLLLGSISISTRY